MSNLITGVLVSLDENLVKKVEEVTLPQGDIDEMYRLMDCETFTTGGETPKGDTIWCDDNGLYGITDTTQVTYSDSFHQPLMGKLLILGFDPETGDSVSVKSTVEEIEALIKWCEPMHVAYLLMKSEGII